MLLSRRGQAARGKFGLGDLVFGGFGVDQVGAKLGRSWVGRSEDGRPTDRAFGPALTGTNCEIEMYIGRKKVVHVHLRDI